MLDDDLENMVNSYADFRSMGRGIEARYKRCREWWAPHIRYTREFIVEQSSPSQKVAVLGAGRLYDIDLPSLLERAEEVHLFDADPGCLTAWRQQVARDFRRRVVPHIEDLTGCLKRWTEPLRREAGADRLAQYVRGLRAPLPSWASAGYGGIISLNLLGQIPLYWRDRVLEVRPELSEEEGAALVVSMAELQRAHLHALSAASAQWCILITDTEYYFYSVDRPGWRIESALYGDLSLTCFGQPSEITASDAWLWHLAPQFVEADDEGEIHRVEARLLRRIA
jgi:hypothetical protein